MSAMKTLEPSRPTFVPWAGPPPGLVVGSPCVWFRFGLVPPVGSPFPRVVLFGALGGSRPVVAAVGGFLWWVAAVGIRLDVAPHDTFSRTLERGLGA